MKAIFYKAARVVSAQTEGGYVDQNLRPTLVSFRTGVSERAFTRGPMTARKRKEWGMCARVARRNLLRCSPLRPQAEPGSFGAKRLKICLIAISFLLLCLPLFAQDQKQLVNPPQPTITFDLYWAAATPQSYTITVQSSGQASYVSRNPIKADANQSADPDFTLDFTLSPATRDRLFTLARAANYFQGDFAYKKHAVASTGKKTLTYADPTRHFQTTYDYSQNATIEEVTHIFTGVSNTIEHGRKLQFLRRFDKLGLEQELKGMEELAQNGYMVEIQIIAPTLESIANDPAVMNIARERAQRLLATVNPRPY